MIDKQHLLDSRVRWRYSSRADSCVLMNWCPMRSTKRVMREIDDMMRSQARRGRYADFPVLSRHWHSRDA